MSKVDWTKTVRGKNTHSVVELLNSCFEVKYPNGRIQFVRESELENVPEPSFAWINVYPGFCGASCRTREHADQMAGDGRVCVLRLNLNTNETVKEPA